MSSAMSSNQFASSNNMKTSANVEEEAAAEKELKNIEDVIDEVCNNQKREDEPINENIEFEYEICIPQFLHEYSGSGIKDASAKPPSDEDDAQKDKLDDDDAEEGDKLVHKKDAHGASSNAQDDSEEIGRAHV